MGFIYRDGDGGKGNGMMKPSQVFMRTQREKLARTGKDPGAR